MVESMRRYLVHILELLARSGGLTFFKIEDVASLLHDNTWDALFKSSKTLEELDVPVLCKPILVRYRLVISTYTVHCSSTLR